MKLDCSVVRDLYVLYEENELSEEVKGYVEEHLRECEECKSLYESGFSMSDLEEEKTPEPSQKLDEKLMLKLKLSRLRIALVFIVLILFTIFYAQYSQSRAYLVRDFQQYSQDLNRYYHQVDALKRLEKTKDSNNVYSPYNHDTALMLNNINDKYEQVARDFNIYERFGTKKSYPNQCFALQVSTLILTLNNRWQNGYFSEKDEEVYKRLSSELQNLSSISNDYGNKLNSKFFVINTGKLKASFDKINTLAKIYIKYNKLPEEVKYLSKDELKTKIGYVFGVQPEAVSLINQTDFNYTFDVTGRSNIKCSGEIDEVTGRILEILGGTQGTKGDLIEVEKAKETIMGLIKRNFGDSFDASIEFLGINANFSSSNPEDKKYTFKVQPTFQGYNIFDSFNVLLDARNNTIDNYNVNAFKGSTPAAKAEDLKADVKYNYEEALKNIGAPDINKELFKYKDTSFMKSMFTGGYVLVHHYKETVDTTKANPRELYINVETGKEEWPAYADDMLTY